MDIRSKQTNPTVSTSAYTTLKYIGSPTKITGLLGRTGRGRIKNVRILEVGSQKANVTVVLVNADPGALVDGGTPDLAALAATVVGMFSVVTANYVTFGGLSVADVAFDTVIRSNPSNPPTTQDAVWQLLIVTGTPTFSAAGVLRVEIGVIAGEG